ncbi:hypothetical protein LBMAG56_51060 [Verrucomicrobiota bacterium]|nr:hypothetical protein LBMAG56_51060 [Verrucomicrobiota bacterium]
MCRPRFITPAFHALAAVALIALVPPTGADAAPAPASGYDTITQRNPFGLRPPASSDATHAATKPADQPPPPIALTGIAALADRRWACFNLGAKGGSARSVRLAVGQREGDLQLVSVNIPQERVEILYAGQPVQLALRGAAANQRIAAELKEQMEMQAHTRASELYQRRERIREQQELEAAGFATKP